MSNTRLFLCGDVMTGRGIDQILAHPGRPQLFEPYVKSALGYVELAERESGPIARPVDDAYIWGDALAVLERFRPDARIINLETSVTASEDAWPGKGIHYRMHPANVGALVALAPDCCVLANNHVLDWGVAGLGETLDVLHAAGLRSAGAGRDLAEALAPAAIPVADGRVLVFAYGLPTSGVSSAWGATAHRAGVARLPDDSAKSAATVVEHVRRHKRPGDVAVVSLHWGPNWGYAVPGTTQRFSHALVEGGVDAVHGHSSHHPLGIEVYHDRPILYGCGDFLNDYEGIHGYHGYRPELALMYFPLFEAGSRRLLELALVPTRIRRLRVNRASDDDAAWLAAMLDREGARFHSRVERDGGVLQLRWG